MVRRIYVEKKAQYAGKADRLRKDLRGYLGLANVTGLRMLIRYDVENVSDETFEKACTTVFSEPPIDTLYREKIEVPAGTHVFSIEALPGQFDQRADSAIQCLRFIREDEDPIVKTAVTYLVEGKLSDTDLDQIKGYCMNPVDSRIAAPAKPETLVDVYDEPEDVAVMENFCSMEEKDFKALYDSLGLAMTYADFQHIRNHFKDEEKRDPTITEIRVLDTYWSDHCRHTTFSTELKNVTFGEGAMRQPIENTWKHYLAARDQVYTDPGRKEKKFICLMDIALMGMRKLKADGKLTDMEESEENNACTIIVPVEIEGKGKEEWLVFFKNETHNHPTEIEPFGGAATCLGGAIRDPLSGRGYVYQAMRISGAADPTIPVADTLKGKLPQKKIVREAAGGYSSYGNQIGLATGYVKEFYHPGYVAKRMEIGAVMGAAPRAHVIRESPAPGDVVILLGGRTGRDGIGGATGSSKAHDLSSLTSCGAEVQKGNAPTERKLQRLFRRPEVSELIKKCNDFGAGGVSVAIGELADGLRIDLDKVPKKYAGLDGTELAISESQERMAVVVAPDKVKEFLAYAGEENLEATRVAIVTQDPRLILTWRGKEVVNLSRAFMNTNGAHQETNVRIDIPDEADNYLRKKAVIPEVEKDLEEGKFREAFIRSLKDLNVCSQRGLVEMFDSSIGAGSVLMPYGGRFQTTETQAMVAKLPVQGGSCDTVTMMAGGFDPYLSSWSPYHGAQYAVLESVARLVAAGGDSRKLHFTFQEYFKHMTTDPERWSQPISALLGAYEAQIALGAAAIGGKDSMSGSFEAQEEGMGEINVPPTLVSFAVAVAKASDVISPELKHPGSLLVRFRIRKDAYDLPDYQMVRALYDKVTEMIRSGMICSAYALDSYGILPAAIKMSFGNAYGIVFSDDLSPEEMYANALGDLLCEIPQEEVPAFLADEDFANGILKDSAKAVGHVTYENIYYYMGERIPMAEAFSAWSETLERIYPTESRDADGKEEQSQALLTDAAPYQVPQVHVCKNKVAKPTVFIPVFPGTNCEYDSAAAFEKAGANTIVRVFSNQDAEDIRASVEAFEKAIRKSQIIMFPGGFSAGDEPDGSAKFFATAFRNVRIREAVNDLLKQRDGLALGICNGFQAMIKLGLVPNGEIGEQDENSPTLTYNTVGRHISHVAYIRVLSKLSPWLSHASLTGAYANPASHGEGRFVAPAEVLKKLHENGQCATAYCDAAGNVTMDSRWNINGSYMAVEGITSPDGRCFGKMCHAERIGDHVAINIYGEQDMQIFKSGVAYFK